MVACCFSEGCGPGAGRVKGPKGEIDARPRRFYRAAGVVPSEAGWGVALDGRDLRTPQKAPLLLPCRALAEAIAAEWSEQGERIDLLSMTLTRLANVAIDRTPGARAGMEDELVAYAASDMLCVRVGEPAELVVEQSKAFDPWLAWARELLGTEFPVSFGLHPPQPSPAALSGLRAAVARLDAFALTGASMAAPLFGSAILALAVARGALPASDAFELSRLEEAWQNRLWGEDAEARRRTERLRAEAAALERWFSALPERAP